jgi:hypothetical protein
MRQISWFQIPHVTLRLSLCIFAGYLLLVLYSRISKHERVTFLFVMFIFSIGPPFWLGHLLQAILGPLIRLGRPLEALYLCLVVFVVMLSVCVVLLEGISQKCPTWWETGVLLPLGEGWRGFFSAECYWVRSMPSESLAGSSWRRWVLLRFTTLHGVSVLHYFENGANIYLQTL